MKLIRRGDRGERVVDVQNRLATLGFAISADEVGGVFGEATEAAVRAFQEGRGLRPDGLVGADTWRELVEASWRLGDRILYLRAPHLRGDDVRELQDRLATFGFDVGRTDGIFGPRTAAALREFQRNYGLPPDGIVADRSLRALNGLPRIAGDTPVGPIRELEQLRQRPLGLAGFRVALDPADDGVDGEPVPAFDGDQAPLAIARAAEAALAASGVQVFMTRSPGHTPDDHERAALANALDVDVYVRVLVDRARGGTSVGACYFGHERFSSEAGRYLAQLLLDEASAAGLQVGAAQPRTFAVLRETRMPAVVVEVGAGAVTAGGTIERALASAVAAAVRRFAQEPVVV